MQQTRLKRPYAAFAVLIVVSIAVLTGGALLVLGGLHRQAAHRTAARDVLDEGRRIATHLAAQPIVSASSADPEKWNDFATMVKALASYENGLQYVSIKRGDVVVYHEQVGDAPPAPPVRGLPTPDEVAMEPRLLRMGKRDLPVVAFTATFAGYDGAPREVEVGLRRAALSRRENAAEKAVTSMFRLSFAAIAVAFGACIVLLAWAGRRERGRMELRRAEEHLAFSGVLANGIVHDFRNPMSSMRLDVQMLEREAQRENEADYEKLGRLAQRVRHTMDRLDKVFQEFLYISKPAADERVSLELGDCVRDCLTMLHGRLEQSGVTVDAHVPEGLQVQVYEASLRRALVNVLTNAEQFSERGQTIEITAVAERGEAVLTVRDHGPGIPGNIRGHVFDIFMTSRPGGTGLGLFLARAALERSGGSIEIASSDSGGTAICIRLPLAGRGPSGKGRDA